MKREEIFEKYSLVFSKDPMQPIVLFGLEIGDGWLPIIENFCALLYRRINNIRGTIKYYESKGWDEKITALKKEEEEEIEKLPKIEQVKEKFGTLHIYTSHLNPYVDGVIDMAEALSEHICEECGNKGKLYQKGWHRTLCPVHAEERYGEL
jgi:uncharacterized protein YydD (DUF2326 family)